MKINKPRKICKDYQKLLSKCSIYLPILRCRSCEAKRKHREGILNNKDKNHPMYGLKGKLNPNYGKSRPDVSLRLKINNPNKNRIYSQQEREQISRRMKKILARPEVKLKMSSNLKGKIGKESRHWIDGRSFINYPREFNRKLKSQIRKRDNYTCQNCGMTEAEHKQLLKINLHIHHIDYDKTNCKEENLITLCNQCNTKANSNRKFWKELFERKIKCLIK